MKKLFLVILISIIAFVARAQSYNTINGGYKFDALKSLKALLPPKDTTHTTFLDSGSIAWVGNSLRYYNGHHFTPISSGGGGGGGGEDLRQTLLIGNSTAQKIIWDSLTPPPAQNNGVSYHYMQINPMDTSHGGQPYFSGVSSNAGLSGTLGVFSNNVHYRGWNVTAEGSVNVAGWPMLAEGMESRWRPDPANVPYVGIDYTEWHQVYAGPSGRMQRISSYTIDNATESAQYYQTVDNVSLKRSIDDSVYFGQTVGGFQYERFGDHGSWGMSGDASGVQLSHTGGSAIGDVLTMSGFGSAFLPYSLTLSDIDGHHSGSSIQYTDSVGLLMTVSTDRASGGSQFTTPTSSGLGMYFNPGNTTTLAMHNDYTAMVTPVILDDNPSVGAPSQRLYVKSNGTYAVSQRIDNNTTASNTYNLQLVSTGGADENNLLYLLGINKGGASGNKLIHTAATTAAANDNYIMYSESPAQSIWAGWNRYGDQSMTNPVEAVDVNGKVKIDTLDTDGGGNSIVTYDNSTKRLEKRASPDGSATLDFGSTSAGAVTDLTINVTGAASGDLVVLGIPSGSVPTEGVYMAWVSGTDTVTVRFANNKTSGSLDPASGTFKVKIIK